MTRSEAETRREIIDKKLQVAGWNVDDCSQVIQELDIEVIEECLKESKSQYRASHEFSDYALLGRDGRPLAVVEAKKSSKDAEIGREQAKQYCINLQKQYKSELPFCFYTNGHEIYFWDLDNYPPQKVYGFPNRDDLERLRYIRTNKKPLIRELINTQIAGRDYQLKAIRSVMEGIEQKHTKFLLVMATGTGKTRTSIALVDTLMRAGWAERVLFLVDRIALREQAIDSFKEHLPEEPIWPKLGEKAIAKDRRIYISTYPTMLNIIRSEEQHLSPHFFDLIIVDESHRSIYNTYQEILDYFRAIRVGLTATPTKMIDHNTFKLFNCENGLPTFGYSYEEAVNHQPAYLCNFQVMKIRTKFQSEGINKRTVTLDEQFALLQEGKDIDEIDYEGKELEKTVINKGTNALIVKEFMEESIKDQNGVLPGKTIFFCMTISHARRVEKIFDALYPQYKGELAKVIVSDDPRAYGKGGLLDQFKKNDLPRVAISVGMLDTGIDVREIVNLVFAKPVYSYTKFWQMIGRGTRLLDAESIKPWCPQKDLFLILDCWDNFEYFKLKPKGKELKPQIPLPVRLMELRLEKISKAIELNEESILSKEIEILRAEIKELPAKSVVVLDAEADLAKLKAENFWQKLTFKNIEFLRDKIKPLFRTISQTDFKAMRFKKDVLETSLALLAKDSEKFEYLKDEISELISELPLSSNIVAREEQLIKRAQTNNYWATITDEELDNHSERLAPLMKYRDTNGGRDQEKLNLTDLTTTKEHVEFGPEHEALSITEYRKLVEERIAELTKQNPILQKLKAGEAISETDVETLAKTLHNEQPYITLDLLRQVYQNQKAEYLQFIKHILGIEILESFPNTVSKSIDQFISEHAYLSSQQLQFLEILRDYIIEKGDIQKRDLIQSPFTILHPEGIRGLFNHKEIDEIVRLTQNLVA